MVERNFGGIFVHDGVGGALYSRAGGEIFCRAAHESRFTRAEIAEYMRNFFAVNPEV